MRYGLKSNALDQACEALSRALNLSFEMRESSHWGGDYFLCRNAAPFGKTLKLHRNLDIYDNVPMYKDQSAFGLILHCDNLQKDAGLHAVLTGLGYHHID